MGYPKDLLSSRSIIKPGQYALIAPEGLVNNVIPGFENCRISILGSPKLGASFVDYIITMHEGGKNSKGYCGEEDVQCFVYVLSGKVKAKADDQEFVLEESGYLYCPPGVKMYLENMESGDSRYIPLQTKTQPVRRTASLGSFRAMRMRSSTWTMMICTTFILKIYYH